MPRPKPNKAARRFLSHPHSLSDSVKGQLIELLQLRESANIGEVIDEVERTLGIYTGGSRHDVPPPAGYVHPFKLEQTTGGVQHLDNIPRPADYVRTFKPISRDAKNLLDKLQSMGEYLGEQFSIRGADQDSIEQALIGLLNVSEAVVGDFKGKSSKGAGKNTALTVVIRRLRRIFRDSYRGPVTGGSTKGAIKFLSVKERREFEFIKLALTEIKVIRTDKALHRLIFQDSRCALTEGPKPPP